MSDWAVIPKHFAFSYAGNVYIAAPREEGVTVYELDTGRSSVMKERDPEDLTAQRENILNGEVIHLNGGEPITDDFQGFVIDLDGDGKADTVTVESGVNAKMELSYELCLNGRYIGISKQVYQESDRLDVSVKSRPDEATFPKHAGYSMALASLDGKTVSVFLSSEEQTYGMDLNTYENESVTFVAADPVIRGFGKTMDDFIPCQSAGEYVADGWLRSPREGDQLALTGNDTVHTLHRAEKRGEDSFSIDEGPVFSVQPHRTSVGTVQFSLFYYARLAEGGYCLVGEATDESNEIVTVFYPVENNGQIIFVDRTEEYYPLFGSEHVSEELNAYMDQLAEEQLGHASAAVLEELQLFARDGFTRHFLEAEFEEARLLNRYTAFLEGVPAYEVDPTDWNTKTSPGDRLVWNNFYMQDRQIIIPYSVAKTLMERYTGYTMQADATISSYRFDAETNSYIKEAPNDPADLNRFTVQDAVVMRDGSVMMIWSSLAGEEGIALMQRTETNWLILSNHVLKEGELPELPAEQGIRRATRSALIPTENGGTTLNGKPFKPNDFIYYYEMRMTILDRAGKRILLLDYRGNLTEYPLDFCEDPRFIAWSWNLQARYILDRETVVRYSLSGDTAVEEKRVPLPEGVAPEEVLDMEPLFSSAENPGYLLLITAEHGNYLLKVNEEEKGWKTTENGWHMEQNGDQLVIRKGLSVWTLPLRKENVQIYDIGEQLTVLVKTGEDQAELRVYSENGRCTALSRIDLSDWVYLPERLSSKGEPGALMMAPKQGGLYFYHPAPGRDRVEREPEVEDLRSREKDILKGTVLHLTEEKPLDHDFPGFLIDLDQDGDAETVTLEYAYHSNGKIGLVFYVNGEWAGYRNVGNGQYIEDSPESFILPEEKYDLSLVSLDGKTISLLMSRKGLTMVVDFVSARLVIGDGNFFVARARLSGPGKTAEDFVPCRGIEAYVRDGWYWRPSEGDQLDLDGDGTAETIHMFFPAEDSSFGSLYHESIQVGEAPLNKPATTTKLCWKGDQRDWIYEYRFDLLSYDFRADGSIGLKGQQFDGSHLTYWNLKKTDDGFSFEAAQ